MSTVDNGGQKIVFDYKYPLKGSEFSRLFRGFMKPGIYGSGAVLSTNTGSEINITPFRAIFNVKFGLDDNLAVPIYTTATFTLGTGYIDNSKTILCMSYTWNDVIKNFIDFYVRTPATPPSDNEIILGTLIYTGPIITSFDISNRTLGLFDDNYNITVQGNIDVSGTLRAKYIEYAEELKVEDHIITVNDGETGSGVGGDGKAGLEVDRGLLDKQKLIWNENTGKWVIGTDAVYDNIATETYASSSPQMYSLILGY